MLHVRQSRYLQRSYGYLEQNTLGARLCARYNHATRVALSKAQQPTELSEDGVRLLRLRDYGNRSLPLPPVMDELVVERRERHKKPKAPVGDTPKTDFQKELEMNVHAQALATPVRQCSFTLARLPSHFLLPMAAQIQPTSPAAEGRFKTSLLPANLASSEDATLLSPSRTYVLRQKHILDYLSTKRRWIQVVSERMKKWYALKKQKQAHNVDVGKQWEWDVDTPEKVLTQLRLHVVEELRKGVQQGVVVSLQHWEQRGMEVAPACVLVVEPEGEEALERLAESLSRSVPIYDLSSIIGITVVEELMGTKEVPGEATLLVVEPSRETSQLQLALLRLSGYALPTKVA